MRARTHIILFLLCVAAVFGFVMLGLFWSLTDLNPDRPFNEQAARTSERGWATYELYLWPVLALTRAFGDSSALTLFAKFHWIILPLIYGGVIHLILWALIVKLRYLFRRKPDATKPSPTGWE
jgi:hypothetical protein